MKKLVALVGLGLLLGFVAIGANKQDGDKTAKPQSKLQVKDVPKEDADSKTKNKDAVDKKDTKSAEEMAAAENELTQSQLRAIDLLKQAGDEAASISDARSGARMQATAADQLWERDRDFSRKLFESAFDIAVKY